jgi:hypothetical protein
MHRLSGSDFQNSFSPIHRKGGYNFFWRNFYLYLLVIILLILWPTVLLFDLKDSYFLVINMR